MANFRVSILQHQFMKYFIVGIAATIVDWCSFYILMNYLGLYYQFSLVAAFSLGSITNYVANRIYTFASKSKNITGQFSVFIAISAISLLVSMGMMYVFVDFVHINEMMSRIMVTFVMLILNYVMHKNFTFNHRIFK